MNAATKKFDVIIIGSGMGGLSSALILAKHGYTVLVLEKNHQIGGALQVFSRETNVASHGQVVVWCRDPSYVACYNMPVKQVQRIEK